MLALTYRTRPSEAMQIDDVYEAYCLDAAIAEYIRRLKNGERPREKMEKTGDNHALIARIRGER